VCVQVGGDPQLGVSEKLTHLHKVDARGNRLAAECLRSWERARQVRCSQKVVEDAQDVTRVQAGPARSSLAALGVSREDEAGVLPPGPGF
jgi:hypothetical protein